MSGSIESEPIEVQVLMSRSLVVDYNLVFSVCCWQSPGFG